MSQPFRLPAGGRIAGPAAIQQGRRVQQESPYPVHHQRLDAGRRYALAIARLIRF